MIVGLSHFQKDKMWYAVPTKYAEKFEEILKITVPHLFEKHKNLLYLLITQLSPRILIDAGIPVYTATQKEGQFISMIIVMIS
jgi:histone demethylase JARID1